MDQSTILQLAGIAAFVVILAAFLFRPKSSKPPVEPPPPPNGGTTPPISCGHPVALPPFVVGTHQTLRSPLIIDLRYREHGCDSATGDPEFVTGAYDPCGLPLEYMVECPWSVFAENSGVPLNGKWVKFPQIARGDGTMEQDAVVRLWVGWTHSYPLLPVVPACSTTQPPPRAVLTYYVRNSAGLVASSSVFLGSS